jgi:hypothetical protein
MTGPDGSQKHSMFCTCTLAHRHKAHAHHCIASTVEKEKTESEQRGETNRELNGMMTPSASLRKGLAIFSSPAAAHHAGSVPQPEHLLHNISCVEKQQQPDHPQRINPPLAVAYPICPAARLPLDR